MSTSVILKTAARATGLEGTLVFVTHRNTFQLLVQRALELDTMLYGGYRFPSHDSKYLE
jgi:hypothetical protein